MYLSVTNRMKAIPYDPPHDQWDVVSGGYSRIYSYATLSGYTNYTATFIRYFYSLVNNNTAPLLANGGTAWDDETNSEYWASTDTFIWTPQYNSKFTFTPNYTETQFGDGYKQVVKNGINAVDSAFTVTFDGLEENKANAILHFLDFKANCEDGGDLQNAFYVPSLPPYDDTIKRAYMAKDWEDTLVSYKIHDISIELEELNIPFGYTGNA